MIDRGSWQRTVTQTFRDGRTLQYTEYLDMRAAEKRLWEAMRERQDASLRDWLDCALNGWGDE